MSAVGALFRRDRKYHTHCALYLCDARAEHAVVSTAQMVGGIVAAAILDGLTPGPLAVGVGLGLGTNKAQGLFIEMFVTSALTLSVLMLAAGTWARGCIRTDRSHGRKALGDALRAAYVRRGARCLRALLRAVHRRSRQVSIVAPHAARIIDTHSSTARAFGPACIEGFNKEQWIYCQWRQPWLPLVPF